MLDHITLNRDKCILIEKLTEHSVYDKVLRVGVVLITSDQNSSFNMPTSIK